MDLKVQSTLGLEPSDIEKLKQVAGVEVVQLGYSADVFLGNSGRIAKVLSYDPGNNLNQYVLTEGRMPGRGKSSSMREREETNLNWGFNHLYQSGPGSGLAGNV